MYEDVCYNHPFLKEVIARIDFSSPVEILTTNIPPKISNHALSRFPIQEPRKMLTQEVELSNQKLRHRKVEFTEWNYYGSDREKRLTIAPNCFFVTYSRYTSYENLKNDCLPIADKIFTHFSDLRCSRLGLRYINNIELREGNPFDWSRLVDQRLLGLFSRFNDPEHVTRIFNITEFKHEDIQIKFQFGVPNPDYPAVIKRPIFVIDIDASIQGLQGYGDISANLDRSHVHVQSLFEESITDELRGLMGGRKNE